MQPTGTKIYYVLNRVLSSRVDCVVLYLACLVTLRYVEIVQLHKAARYVDAKLQSDRTKAKLKVSLIFLVRVVNRELQAERQSSFYIV